MTQQQPAASSAEPASGTTPPAPPGPPTAASAPAPPAAEPASTPAHPPRRSRVRWSRRFAWATLFASGLFAAIWIGSHWTGAGVEWVWARPAPAASTPGPQLSPPSTGHVRWKVSSHDRSLVLSRFVAPPDSPRSLRGFAPTLGPSASWIGPEGHLGRPPVWAFEDRFAFVAGLGYVAVLDTNYSLVLIYIPWWLLCVGTAAYPSWYFSPWARRRRRRAAGLCTHCGYSRAGLPPAAPCPECGQQPD